MTTKEWAGSRWWRFDFHAHTPASADYGKGRSNHQDLRQRRPAEWLLDFMAAGVDCVAITDHNSGQWVDPAKEALARLERDRSPGFRPLVLFPGVELSVHGGIHLLAIFGPQTTTADIDSLLGAVDYTGTRGASDAVTGKTLGEVARVIAQRGGIAIPAHVHDDKGLFAETSGTTLEAALGQASIIAMEIRDPTCPLPQAYVDKKLSWTQILGSDSHHPDGPPGSRFPGSHCTWVKMGSPTIEGLRLALVDGAVEMEHGTHRAPNVHAALVLKSLEVSEAYYMGRKKPLRIEFNPWLTTIIGGRGSGKSTLIELLRTALGRRDEIPKALQGDFERYFKTSKGRNDGGLLTDDTRLTLEYLKDGTTFQIEWTAEKQGHIMRERETNGTWREVVGDVAQRFPVRLYSQKHVFQLARDPLALLRVVDEATLVNRKDWNADWTDLSNRFKALQARIRELQAPLQDEPALRGELDDVLRRLKIFESAGHAQVLKEYDVRARQKEALESWTQSWADTGPFLRKIASGMVPSPLPTETFHVEQPADQQLVELAAARRAELEAASAAGLALAAKADENAQKWRTDLHASAWQETYQASQDGYRNLVESLGEAGQPKDFAVLVERRQALERRLSSLADKRRQADELREQAGTLLKQVRNHREMLSVRRETFLSATLTGNPHVQIRLLRHAAREDAELALRQALHREAGFDSDFETLLSILYGGPNGTCTDESLNELKEVVSETILSPQTPFAAKHAKFAKYLGKLSPETVDDLLLWFPEDYLRVQYSPHGDGHDFRSIESGSPGQMTAALLAFLLSYSQQPLVLDQPEDDLDSHLIYGLIVRQIRNAKLRRQIVIVTHNPNIVVNGDAELVIALSAGRGGTTIEAQGSLQERSVREVVCNIMEGGRQAFEQRYRRIALEVSRTR